MTCVTMYSIGYGTNISVHKNVNTLVNGDH